MKIMLKLVCMLMTVILCACTSVDKKNTVDDSKYNLDADYSIVHSNFASIKQMEMTKDYILLFPKALERGKTGEGVIISYLDNDKMEILEATLLLLVLYIIQMHVVVLYKEISILYIKISFIIS